MLATPIGESGVGLEPGHGVDGWLGVGVGRGVGANDEHKSAGAQTASPELSAKQQSLAQSLLLTQASAQMPS
jgi:hypothetical protein